MDIGAGICTKGAGTGIKGAGTGGKGGGGKRGGDEERGAGDGGRGAGVGKFWGRGLYHNVTPILLYFYILQCNKCYQKYLVDVLE